MNHDEIIRINTRQDLIKLAEDLNVRGDWHEPDNQDVDVLGFGCNFDNAGFWGLGHMAEREALARTRMVSMGDNGERVMEDGQSFVEMFLVLYKDGKAVAEVNLATLFAFACGYEG